MDYGLWTTYGLQTGYKKQTVYKTRTRYKNVDCGLSLKNIALIVSSDLEQFEVIRTSITLSPVTRGPFWPGAMYRIAFGAGDKIVLYLRIPTPLPSPYVRFVFILFCCIIYIVGCTCCSILP